RGAAQMSNLITDEVRDWIGRSDPPITLEVTRRDIVKYSIATEQRLEKYLCGDEAPPMFLFGAERPLTPIDQLGPDGLMQDKLLPELPLKRVMAGGVKKKFSSKIRPGDTLNITRTLSDIYEKSGSSGPLIFVVYEINVTNQDEELVLQEIQSRIIR
ncbi:MAG: FAS1-like dehydratase domain-containing protein, partial [Gammaproteobacteria bacterium]